jgi:hypothetical protein
MQRLITATAVMVLLGGSVAVAQNSARTRNSGPAQSSQSGNAAADAPIGHKQPRPSDVPSQSGSSKLDDENAALDRKLKSICRGC